MCPLARAERSGQRSHKEGASDPLAGGGRGVGSVGSRYNLSFSVVLSIGLFFLARCMISVDSEVGVLVGLSSRQEYTAFSRQLEIEGSRFSDIVMTSEVHGYQVNEVPTEALSINQRIERQKMLLGAARPFQLATAPYGDQPYIFFTHIRRTGGSAVEMKVLQLESIETEEDKLLRLRHQRVRKRPPPHGLICLESYHARYYDMEERRLSHVAWKLNETQLQWRHCPFGLHRLLRHDRPYLYATILRAPAERMVSWYKLMKAFRKTDAPHALAYYSIRQQMTRPDMSTTLLSVPHPFRIPNEMPIELETRLDDNYQVRMICGPPAHNATEVTEEHLRCAMHNLLMHYGVVGVRERFDETVCLLAVAFNLEPQRAIRDAQKSPDKPVDAGKVPPPSSEDQLAPPGSLLHRLIRYDRVLHAFAEALMLLHLEQIAPQCKGIGGVPTAIRNGTRHSLDDYLRYIGSRGKAAREILT